MRLLLDVNVIVDVLADREPWVDESAAVLALLGRPGVKGFAAAHTMTTLAYLLSKSLGRERTAAVLLDLLDHVEMVPLDRDLMLRALALGWPDLEDAVQAMSAQRANADYLVTRNTGDFGPLAADVVTPGELLAVVPGG